MTQADLLLIDEVIQADEILDEIVQVLIVHDDEIPDEIILVLIVIEQIQDEIVQVLIIHEVILLVEIILDQKIVVETEVLEPDDDEVIKLEVCYEKLHS
ncbi:hypothetical protein HOK00_06270 [bacterium]|nr:hypothetical protein [bacterium]